MNVDITLEVTDWRCGLFESGAYNRPRVYHRYNLPLDEAEDIVKNGMYIDSDSYIYTDGANVIRTADNNIILQFCELVIPAD